MKKIFKYVLGCTILMVLSATYAGAEEVNFDLLDINTSHASFQQSRRHGDQHLNAAQRSRENSLNTDHNKHSKKYRGGKHNPSPAFFNAPLNSGAFVVYPNLVLTPSVPVQYRYIFYREINPPPPKVC